MASLGSSSGRIWTWSLLRQPTLPLLALTLIFSLFSSVRAQYLVVNQPSASTKLANGSPYPFTWTKGLDDGLDTFDIELVRLHEDGIYLVAQSVPAKYRGLNVLLQDVPEGDDYFFICFNSTHSIIYSVSSRFSVTNSSSVQNPSPNPSVPTVTISGTPNPLKQFAATLGPAASAGIGLSPNTHVLGFGVILALCAALVGGAVTLW